MKKTGSKALFDPFVLSLEDYLALDEEQQWALTQKLYERYADWTRQQFQKTGAALLVLCDRKVIYSSSDRYDFQADKVVEQAQRQWKKPCFILTHPVLVEEVAAWSDLGRGDHYPTVELFLGGRVWNDSEVFTRGAQIVSDFDTGNPALAVFDEALCYRLSGETRPVRQDVHLGRPYRYRPRLMKVGLLFAKDNKGNILANRIQNVLDAFKVTIVGYPTAASTSAEEPGEEKNIPIVKGLRPDKGAVVRAIEVQERHTPDLLSIPGVTGTGVGFSRETGQVVIRVYVEEKTPDLEQSLPRVLEGIPVEIIVAGPFHDL